ncbi:MAG: PepSY domain-containing protein [Leptolyngbyaceae cyanobacterium MO_188.B28]|nr:PepSY domain-containing protein [Leptolyngbyaceae cyanobacterium MO_188.B28]
MVNDPPHIGESPANRFYRTIWRWHFYAGLFVIPFMLVLATTGIIYLFKPQLDAVMYHRQMFVQPSGGIAAYTQQLEAAQRVYPDAAISKFTPSVAANRSGEVELVTSDNQTLTVFVNPYTTQVLGERNEDNNLQANARRLHSELMIGPVGDYLIELAACWGLVLLGTGLYLWIPRNGFSLWGTLLPRLGSQSQRVFWRDLHTVPGFYSMLLIGFLILTGLPWTGFLGETFAQVWNRFPAQMWDDFPQSTVLTGALNRNGIQSVPWAVEQFPMPQSDLLDEHPYQPLMDKTPASKAVEGNTPVTPINLDFVIALAQSQGAPPGFNVSWPDGEKGVYTISAFPDDPTQEVTMHIDQYSGKVLADVRWRDYGLVPKAVELGIAVHMGKYFGLENQLLMLAACLAVILLCVSGGVMWWKRRPVRRIGAPTIPSYAPQWKLPIGIIAVLGVVFPLVGFSLVAVLLLDYLVLSRIPVLQRIFN